MKEKRMALLIDAENTSAKYLDAMLNELKEYGIITYQRMYGDFSDSRLSEWNKKALEYAIVPIQQPRYVTGKNAADIMLVIDAMDILYQGNVDGFCIVTSDSDFTRLVNRLREDGMSIIGMGKSDASKTFIAACNEYKFLDKICEVEAEEELQDRKADSITPLKEIKSALNEVVQQSENKGERANLGSTKSRLQRIYPDFDERNYGYHSIKKFISEATRFDLVQEGSSVYVVRPQKTTGEQIIKQYIYDLAKEGVELGSLGNLLHNRFPDFKCREYGYSQLSKFAASIEGVVMVEGIYKNNTVKILKQKEV